MKRPADEAATLSLDEILYRLLYHRSFRARFLAGELDALGIVPAHRDALAAIDASELQAMSRRIRREVMHGCGGGGGLKRAFPHTLQWLRQGALRHADAENSRHSVRRAVDDFVASDDFADYRDIPFGERGISLEEAFYQYACGMEDRSERRQASLWLRHEFLAALMALLVVHPEPGFVIRSQLVRSNAVCSFAVTRVPSWFVRQLRGSEGRGGESEMSTYLYAASAGKLIMGPVHGVVEVLLEAGSATEAMEVLDARARDAGISRIQVEALEQRLIELRLLPVAEPLRAVS